MGADGALSFVRRVELLREFVSMRLSYSDEGGLLRKLLLNEEPQSSAEAEAWGLLRLLGFVHVFSAAGIHLYVLAKWVRALFFWSGRFLRLGPAGMLRLQLISDFASFGVGLFSWTMCGMRPGMLRPWALVGLRQLAQFSGWRWRAWTPLLLALGLDMIWGFGVSCFSGAAWAPGRLHYALAVGGGLAAQEVFKQSKESPWWVEHLALAVGSWGFIALADLFSGGVMSVGTPIVSLISLPIITGLVFPLAWVGVLFGGVEISSRLAVFTLHALSRFPDPLWVSAPGTLSVAICLAVPVALFFSFRSFRPLRPFRCEKCLLFLPLLLLIAGLIFGSTTSVHKSHLAVRVEQLDVGQGDAALIHLENGEAGLIDSGSEKTLFAADWIRLLAERNLTRLRFVALSHLDEDHAGGLKKLADLIPIECVSTSREELETERGAKLEAFLKERKIRIVTWEEDCFPFEALGPTRVKARRGRAATGNDRMSAFLIPVGKDAVYINTGDATSDQETAWIPWFQAHLRAIDADGVRRRRILKVSHHGSRTSSAREWLAALHPTEVWISSGIGNRYGHPTAETLSRLEKLGVRIRRTDESGFLE